MMAHRMDDRDDGSQLITAIKNNFSFALSEVKVTGQHGF
jgi:hypothetical protein